MRAVEHRLELGWGEEALPESVREAMEGYNCEDCLSTAKLRDWLEGERRKLALAGRACHGLWTAKKGRQKNSMKDRSALRSWLEN